MTQIPLFQPPSEWTPPERVPDLSDAKEIAIDFPRLLLEPVTKAVLPFIDITSLPSN